MSLLTAVQDAYALLRLGITLPASVVGNTDPTIAALRSIAKEVALSTAQRRAWQQLQKVHTITGDGTATSFALPADYVYFGLKPILWHQNHHIALTYVSDLNQWLYDEIHEVLGNVRQWTIYGDQLQILPAVPNGDEIKVFYTTDLIWRTSAGTPIKNFTVDTDEFFLGDRILMLGIIWQWRQSIGEPYAEEMSTFETAVEHVAARSDGMQVMYPGRPRHRDFAYNYAYPANLSET